MAKRFAVFLVLCTVALSTGLTGCATFRGDSDHVKELQAKSEIVELRMTNFEERLALVEQDMGVLRSYGDLPEGARRVDPAPSLAKFPNLTAAQTAAQKEPADVDDPIPPLPYGDSRAVEKGLPSAATQGGDPSTPQAPLPSSQPPVLVPLHAPLSVSDGQGQTAKAQPDGYHASVTPPPSYQTGMEYTEIGPGDKAAGIYPGTSMPGSGGRPVQQTPPASAVVSSPSKPSPSKPSPSGSLRGLPSSFRTGVRAYDEALAMYYRHEYAKSRKAFTNFIEGNKGHKLLPNALYWQGESAYSQADYVSAILSFKSITSQYPKHPKAPDALLKIGMSYERLKDSGNAQFYWQVLLDDFPQSSAARVARGKMRR